jgi:hypothetical protein
VAEVKPVIKTAGPLFFVADNAPKVAIFTAMLYIIVTYINIISGNFLGDQIQQAVTQIMVVGALFCLPLALFDIAFTGLTRREADIIMMGFVNYFALLTEYIRSNWAEVKPIVQWVMYLYLAMFVGSLFYVVLGYMLWRYKKARA